MVTLPVRLTEICSVYVPGYTKIVCAVLSAGSDANAAVKFRNELAMDELTETRTAPDGGVVPLVGCEVVALVEDTGVVVFDEVPLTVIPLDVQPKDGAKLYAIISIHDVLPRKVPRSYAAT